MCVDDARGWIRAANSIAVLTGAGISAESGIPTFRGAGGLWKQFRAEDLATETAFQRDPKLVWEWYDWRRGLVAQAQPNAGHRALADLEPQVPRFALITQNVDGLHRRAGSQNVLEVHGSLWTLRCMECEKEWRDETTPHTDLPRCSCGAIARPGVVWFGESLPRDVWNEAERAAATCDVFIVIGTSAVVYPAAGLARIAVNGGAKLIEVNLEPTPLTQIADCSLFGPASEMLPKVVERE